jgi:hypothetical protein
MAAALDALLRAQGLTEADIEANRAGSVSDLQARQVEVHRRRLAWIPLSSITVLMVGSTGFAIREVTNGAPTTVFVAPAIALVFCALFWIFFVTVLRLPSIAGRTVRPVVGPVAGLLRIANRGGYVVSIGGVRYKGVALGLSPALKDETVTAYVVPELKMVVAITPG